MDPQNGEISRAMRNRGVEICLLDECTSSEDLQRMVFGLGIPFSYLTKKMVEFHQQMVTSSEQKHSISNRHLLRWARLTLTQAERGISFSESLFRAMDLTYFSTCNGLQRHSIHERWSSFIADVVEDTYNTKGAWPIMISLEKLIDFSLCASLERYFTCFSYYFNLFCSTQLESAQKIDEVTCLSSVHCPPTLSNALLDRHNRHAPDNRSLIRVCDRKLLIASLMYLESLSLNHMQLGLIWANVFAKSIVDVRPVQSLLIDSIQQLKDSRLLENVKSCLKVVLDLTGVCPSEFEPVDLRNDDTTFRLLQRTFKDDCVFTRYVISLYQVHLFLSCVLENKLEEYNLLQLSNSVLYRSYCLWKGTVFQKAEQQQAEVYLYEYCHEIQSLVLNSLTRFSFEALQQIQSLQELADARDFLAASLRGENFLLEQLWYALKQLRKKIVGVTTSIPQLSQLFFKSKIYILQERITSSLFGTNSFAVSPVWKVDCVRPLRSSHLHDMRSKFLRISASLTSQTAAFQSKKMLLEALATIDIVDQHGDKNRNEFEVILEQTLQHFDTISLKKSEDVPDCEKTTSLLFSLRSHANAQKLLSFLAKLFESVLVGNSPSESSPISKYAQDLHSVLSDYLNFSDISPALLLPQQLFIWLVDAKKFTAIDAPLLLELLSAWHAQTWHGNECSDLDCATSTVSLNGPTSVFLFPSQVLLLQKAVGRASAVEIIQQSKAVERLEAMWCHVLNYTANLSCHHFSSDELVLQILFLHTICCFSRSFKEWKTLIRDLKSFFSRAKPVEVAALSKQLKESSNSRFVEAVEPLVIPLLKNFQNLRIQLEAQILSHSWILLGCLRLHLLVPLSNIDPASRYYTQYVALEHLKEKLALESLLRRESQFYRSGHTSNSIIEEIQNKLQSIELKQEKLERLVLKLLLSG